MNRLLLACGVVATTATLLLAQQPIPPRIPAAAVSGSEPIELVFLRDRGPVLLRLHVQVNGQPIHVRWQQYLGRWFDYLDRKNRGALDEAALLGAPNAQSMRNLAAQGGFLPNRGQSLTLRDFGKSAGETVSRAEFLDYYQKNGIGPIQVAAAPADATGPANDALFKMLDTDGDGKLSRAEIEAARDVLAKLDVDDDELISMRELAPTAAPQAFRALAVQPPPRGVPFQVEGKSFFHVNSDESRTKLAFLLLAHYDKDNDKRLSRAESGMSEADFAKLDRNGDGWLDLAELAHFTKRAPAVEGVVDMRSPGQNSGAAEPLVIRSLGSLPAKALTQGRGQATISLDGADLVVQNLDAGATRVAFNQFSFILQQLKAADTMMRGYVELKDLDTPQLQFLRSIFPILDRNEDGKLTEQEAQAYFDLQTQSRDFTAGFYVQEQGRNWFQILDANRDGQLSPRELLSAWSRLAPYDKNGDGYIDASELPLQFRVVFSPANQFFANVQVARPLGDVRRPGADNIYPPHAPLWFRKMDRNRDGDVSRREFLGSQEDFDRIDTNHDGLIDADEAAAATPNASAPRR